MASEKRTKNFDKTKVIDALFKRGFKFFSNPGTDTYDHIEVPRDKKIGLKTWSMLDFLKLPIHFMDSKNEIEKIIFIR